MTETISLSSILNLDSSPEVKVQYADQIGKLILERIEEAKEKGFTSYQLVTELVADDVLTAPAVKHGYTDPAKAFRLPNFFGEIIKDTEKAKGSGTIFVDITSDHIIIQDKYPAAATHVLVIPKLDYTTIEDMPVTALGELYLEAVRIAFEVLKLPQVRLLININPPNQEVPHVHLHIMSQVPSSMS